MNAMSDITKEAERDSALKSNERLIDGVLQFKSRDGVWYDYSIVALSGLLLHERRMFLAAAYRADSKVWA